MMIIFISLLLVLPPVLGQTSYLRDVTLDYHDEQKTWSEAQASCRQQNLDLLTIQSIEQNNLITNLGKSGWIGLYRKNKAQPWKWSRGDETATFFQWASSEPNNLDTEFCVLTLPEGVWHNYPSDHKTSYFCPRENLFLVKENKTWLEALNHCRSVKTDQRSNEPLYDLATLISDDDHNYAREKAQAATTDEVWTGLRFLGDAWFWMGGEEVQYQDIPTCPVFSCGVLERKTTTFFGIRACEEKRNFFCYKKP